MPLDISIAELRKEYRQQTLSENNVSSNPVSEFAKWWNEAILSKIEEPNAMALATCNTNGKPSVRIVLLKGFSNEGFIFFTNYESRKGLDLLKNPYAALTFFWKELERQVRIEGSVKKISAAESDEYFSQRPTASQLGAWSSPQSKVIKTRELLEDRIEHFKKMYGNDIPRPPYWGGYIVEPFLFEFWQGRPGRLHDRIQYSRLEFGWQIERLAP
jgi:pyridoxamine 5'-phosphate oxidase